MPLFGAQAPTGLWTPADYGYRAFSFDPVVAVTSNAPTGAGIVQLMRVHLPVTATVTNVLIWVATGGTGLTAGQNFAALYSAAGARLDVTADQSTNWAGTGLITMPLAGGAITRTAADYYVAWWSNGTGLPVFMTRSGANTINGTLGAAALRCATADTGITTTGPANLGAMSSVQTATWVALS